MTSEGYILTVDQGTTGTRASLVDHSGQILWTTYKEVPQIYPRPGWVEQDPLLITESVFQTIEDLLDDYEVSPNEIRGLGLTNQRETTILWNKETGEPISNAVVWQCRRTADMCNDMKEKGLADKVYEVTGLPIDPYFSATKIRWILDNVPGAHQMARNDKLAFGTVDSWLIWHFTNGRSHITDVSNASRTMLFDIKSSEWSKEMLEIMDIPENMLPEVVSSSGNITTVSGNHFGGYTIPISGIAGDQQSALFGQCCFNPGMLKVTYGTGAFLLMNTGSELVRSGEGLLSTVAWDIEGEITYALEGGVFSAGSAVQWLRDEMGLISQAEEIEILANSVSDNGGVYFVPAFNGLGSPYWDPFARGSIQGLTRGSNKGHLARAILESIAYQCNEVLSLMFAEANRPITSLKADGGASSNGLLMQFQADISGFSVNRAQSLETTSLGAAYLAGLGIGFWETREEIARLWKTGGDYIPTFTPEIREKLKRDWRRAANRSLKWIS